jgi:CSLREA domain-containing protein
METERSVASKALAFGLVATLMILIMLLAAKPAQAATITVNTNVDDSTANSNCTLREAITAANTNAAVDGCTAGESLVTDTINFAISGTGVRTISPSSALPTITDPVTIDGTTQPDDGGVPVVELNGSGAETA